VSIPIAHKSIRYERILVLGFIAGPVVNQPFVIRATWGLVAADGLGHTLQPICPASLNQALNPFNTAHLGHGTLGPHALGRERDHY
jgi:hypothetical protein